MQSHPSNNAVSPIQKLVARLAFRIRAGRAADYAFSIAAICLLIAAGIVALSKTGWLDADSALKYLCILIVLPIPAAIIGWIQRLDKIALAQKIDQSHDLHDRFSTALTLADSPHADSSPAAREFSRAQIEDALKYVDKVRIAQAAPFRKPDGLIPFMLFLTAVVALWFYPVPDHAQPLPPPPVITHSPLLDSATIAIERNRLEDIKNQLAINPDLESQQLVQEIEDLLTAVENQEISEREFLERLDAIEKKFFTDREPPPVEDLADALKQAADALRKEAGKDLAQQKELDAVIKALQEKDLEKASQAVEKLAEKLLADNISAKDAEQLAKLLEKFADKIDLDNPRLKDLFEKNKDAFEKLSEQFKDRKDLTSGEKDMLKKAEKDLERARHKAQVDKSVGTGRALEQLQKETKEMAEKLKNHAEQEKKNAKSKKPEPDQPDFQQQVGRNAKEAAEKLEQQSKEQQGEQAKQDAHKQIQEMRESMKRAQTGKEEQQKDQRRGEQVRDFLERAKGEQEARSDKQMEQAGQESSESGEQQTDKAGAEQQPKQQGNEPDKGTEADGSGDGSGSSDRENKLKQENQGRNDSGSDKGGEQDETKLDSKRVQENLKGEKGQGQSKSEIIQGASEEGFATAEYKDVYGDYSSVVEEVMEREKVPSGYRYYIKRYFQLIKPQQ